MSLKDTKIKLTVSLHKIRIRYYKNKYPKIDDIIIAKLKNKDEKVGYGYYMDLIEYENKEALIVYKEVSRNSRKKIVFNTFNPETNYPLVVSEQIVKRNHPDSAFQTDSENEDDIEETFTLDEYDINDPSMDVKIGLTNKVLSENDKKEAMIQYAKYKQIHNIVHNYGALLKLESVKSQEEIDNINVDEYKQFLEGLAENTIWKYPKDKAIEIFTEIRNDTDKVNTYFNEGENTETFIQAIIKSIPKTKYTVSCSIKMQTLDIDGINVIKSALENIVKNGISAQVISAPEYLLKIQLTDIEKIKTTLNEVLLQTTVFMGEHMGFVQIVKCEMSNNLTDMTEPLILSMMQSVQEV